MSETARKDRIIPREFTVKVGIMKWTVLFLFFSFSYLLCLCKCNKYAMPDMNERTPFRIGKINLIWEKAKKTNTLDDKVRAELFAELALHDRKEIELKRKRMENTDRDGLFEAEVRNNLADILNKYGLQEHFPDGSRASDHTAYHKAYDLKDDNLRKLMTEAKSQGFSDNEIETLQQELGHHQMKLDEYNALKDEYHEKYEGVDNSLENLDDQDKLWKELHWKNLALKEKNKNLQENLDKIKRKVKKEKVSQFDDPRVINLWTMAMKSGLKGEELESVKEELTHFEHRIKKTEFMKNEIEHTNKKIQEGKEFDTEFLEKRKQDMLDKAEHYEAMVDKRHADIKKRLQKRLDEL